MYEQYCSEDLWHNFVSSVKGYTSLGWCVGGKLSVYSFSITGNVQSDSLGSFKR